MFLNKFFCLMFFFNLEIPSIKLELAGLLEGHSLFYPTCKQQEAIRTDITKEEKKSLLTLSTFMIWNLWEMSAVLAGSRDLPDTNLMKSTRSSLENSSSVCQNHCTSWCCSSTSRYRTTFFKTSTEISGIPHTICSSCFAVRRDSSGTGMIHDIPSRTAATCSQEKLFIQCVCRDWAPTVNLIGLGMSCLLICSPDPLLIPQISRHKCPCAWPTLLASDPLLELLPACGTQILLLVPVQSHLGAHLPSPTKSQPAGPSPRPTSLTHTPTHVALGCEGVLCGTVHLLRRVRSSWRTCLASLILVIYIFLLKTVIFFLVKIICVHCLKKVRKVWRRK